jgi:GntR family transcriptional regulator
MIQRSIPLSQQVANDILASIEAGALARPGDGLLPSEAELSQRYSVSRATVREALSRLEQRGVIMRRHGVGTFVNSKRLMIESGLERLESLDTLARRMGLQTQVADLHIEVGQAKPNDLEHLRVEDGTQVISVSRVIKIDNRPVAYLVDIVPADILSRSELGDDFNGSVLDILLRRGKPALSHSLTEIVLEDVNETVAHYLHLKRSETLMKLVAQLFAVDGRVVDYSLSYFIPGFFRFHIVRRIDPCDT